MRNNFSETAPRESRRCHRCQGMMVLEKYYGPGEPFWGWRCYLCGEILDPLICENRRDFLQPPDTRHRTAPGLRKV